MVESTTFEQWINDRKLQTIGTNYGSESVPFQGWQKFKEAYAPELVSRAVTESKGPVRKLLDPFGGSGTSALTSQFLGIDTYTIEVNPYLADLIEAKLTKYDLDSLERDLERLTERIGAPTALEPDAASDIVTGWLPPTFVEPGIKERWLFSRETAAYLHSVLHSVNSIEEQKQRRLFRVIVGGCLVDLSNARVSGKGRRYRSNWRNRQADPQAACRKITSALEKAVQDIKKHNNRKSHHYRVIRGDARECVKQLANIDLVTFSPPYPNSFDYTDVYNIELWMLGYLSDMTSNKQLRESTLASHVQVSRAFGSAPTGSPTLETVGKQLREQSERLWSPHIPAMVDGYFADMANIILDIKGCLNPRSEIWMVVGDSRYAGIDIPVADILAEITDTMGFQVAKNEPFRSMRSSPQQGAQLELSESLIVLRR